MRKRRKRPKLLVEKKTFDSVLNKLLRSNPAPLSEMKTSGKHGSKKPILIKP